MDFEKGFMPSLKWITYKHFSFVCYVSSYPPTQCMYSPIEMYILLYYAYPHKKGEIEMLNISCFTFSIARRNKMKKKERKKKGKVSLKIREGFFQFIFGDGFDMMITGK